MHRLILAVVGLVLTAVPALAQDAREITFFSEPGFSGARYTATGDRNNANLPFRPRSALIAGGGSWQVCSGNDGAGSCDTIAQSTRDLQLRFATVGSIKVNALIAVSPWREIVRLNVLDRADRDLAGVNDQTPFRQVMVCAERKPIRIRRAELGLGNGQWMRLFLPVVLDGGRCSKPIDLLRGPRRIHAVRFEYEAWSAGVARGTVVVKALPQVVAQPR